MAPHTQHSTRAPHVVTLDPDHPGFRDAAYRERRDHIARIALEHRWGQPIPDAPYTDKEQSVWRDVWASLHEAHGEFLATPIREMLERFPLDREVIPQLSAVNARIQDLTGFTMEPVAGLVDAMDFLAALGRGHFCSTQYIRHHSVPLYTPEPDIVHELVGHAALLSNPDMAALQRHMGRAVHGASPTEVDRLIRVYWYTIEFGVLWEDGQVMAYGAGLLSSAGELAQIRSGPELRAWDLDEMASTPYDPTQYQGTLWVAPSWSEMVRDLWDWVADGGFRDAPTAG